MKKTISLLLAALVVLSMLTGCGKKEEQKIVSTTIDLQGQYTLEDPSGVEYDTRTVLYMPTLESAEEYAEGFRDTYTVFYGTKENTGVYMYNVVIFDTEENAKAYAEANNCLADGKVTVSSADAAFFEAMAAFMPELSQFIDNYTANGAVILD